MLNLITNKTINNISNIKYKPQIAKQLELRVCNKKILNQSKKNKNN